MHVMKFLGPFDLRFKNLIFKKDFNRKNKTMAASTFVFSITTLSLLVLVLALINHPPLAFAQPRFSRYVCVEYTINNHTTDGAAYKANLNHLLTTLTTDHHRLPLFLLCLTELPTMPLEMDLKFPSTIIPCFEATGQTEEEMARMGFMQYDFDTIRIGTDKFSDENKVGEGGFGAVYKGKLPNGRIVAVKRLSQASRQGDVEFKNEVVLLSKLRHRNLVKLLGFSFKENEELLIYEFLQNASLQKFIFDPLKPGGLDWTTRYKIIEGITRGLVYLHEDSRIKIVHQNLKAHNILLDAEMNAKISDSGIARLFALEQTQDDTCTIIGNVGCMAPEYIRYGHLSSKSNVFSYGVLVLEIVTGHKENYQTVSNIENTKYPLISYARRNWREGRTLLNIVDPTIEIQSETTMNEVTKCIHIGLLCTQEDVDERPKMTDVLLMLKSDLADFPNPSQPSFFMSTIS
ncbi:cysteine-rich receptor-like protein kinase 44 isoform X1 [Cucumis melo]|uniref:Cysteine-rich receptor-like protein kinase 44 isoform X1 n=1 Tax=Cucumis melo TaxID=3656 RepID=A0ABM3KDX6_CUCME|nr:cysteine-rich receptor-like protein kinase 44 isoform X1 [Cucumis melo]